MKKKSIRKKSLRKKSLRKRRRGGARRDTTEQEEVESRITVNPILRVEDQRGDELVREALQLENIFPEQIPSHTVETARLVDEAIHQYGMVIQAIPIVHGYIGREMLIRGSLQPIPPVPPVRWYSRLIRSSQPQIDQPQIDQLRPHRQFLCRTLSISPFLADLLGFAYAYKRQHPDDIVRLPILRSLQLAFPNIGFPENAVQYRYASFRLSAILSMGSLPIFSENIADELLNIPVTLFSPLSYIYEYDPTRVHINLGTVRVSVVQHMPWIKTGE